MRMRSSRQGRPEYRSNTRCAGRAAGSDRRFGRRTHGLARHALSGSSAVGRKRDKQAVADEKAAIYSRTYLKVRASERNSEE